MSSQLAVWSIRQVFGGVFTLISRVDVSSSNKWVVEPGNFNIFVGTSEEVYLNTTLTVQ